MASSSQISPYVMCLHLNSKGPCLFIHKKIQLGAPTSCSACTTGQRCCSRNIFFCLLLFTGVLWHSIPIFTFLYLHHLFLIFPPKIARKKTKGNLVGFHATDILLLLVINCKSQPTQYRTTSLSIELRYRKHY